MDVRKNIGCKKERYHTMISLFDDAMDLLVKLLSKTGILTKDLDCKLLRASMVIIFLLFGYQKWFP
jgi:hypothetical protein